MENELRLRRGCNHLLDNRLAAAFGETASKGRPENSDRPRNPPRHTPAPPRSGPDTMLWAARKARLLYSCPSESNFARVILRVALPAAETSRGRFLPLSGDHRLFASLQETLEK